MIEKVVDILERAKADIQSRMASEGINASGRSSASWRVIQYDGGVRLVYGGPETAPLATLEVGRPAGNVPGGFRTTKAGVQDVSNTFKAILVRWAREKGIPDFGWGQATLLGRRIAKEGTLRHTHPVDVYTSIVMETAETVKDGLRSVFTMQIHETIRAK